MTRTLLVAAGVLALASACQTPPTYCHSSMVQEDGGGIYFERDEDGGGRYFHRDGGGRYFHRDESKGEHQGICRRGVLVTDS